MQTKKNTLIFIIFGLLALTALASAIFYFSQPQAVALAESQPTSQPQILDVDELQTSSEIARELPVLTVNDTTVEITSVKFTQFNIEIGICYTALDDGEWRARVGQLKYGENAIYADSIEYLEGETLADSKSAGTRCALVRYIIEDPDAITLPVEFSIGYFYAPYRELYSPCQEMQQRLATSPKAQEYGLKISCTDDAEKGPSVSLDEYSKSVSVEEAQKVFDVIATSEVHGEWKFILTDLEK
jgi:hypothetical protein